MIPALTILISAAIQLHPRCRDRSKPRSWKTTLAARPSRPIWCRQRRTYCLPTLTARPWWRHVVASLGRSASATIGRPDDLRWEGSLRSDNTCTYCPASPTRWQTRGLEQTARTAEGTVAGRSIQSVGRLPGARWATSTQRPSAAFIAIDCILCCDCFGCRAWKAIGTATSPGSSCTPGERTAGRRP